ncbi:MAG: terminase family protein [Cyanobacteria bacterium J06638_20]
MKPAIELLPYQVASLKDRPRFKCLFWARGVRKTFTATLEIVDSVFESESQGRPCPWNLISRGERQALEAMNEAKRHFRAYSIAASEIDEKEVYSESEGRNVKVYQILTNTGSRILSLPANPDTIRGYTSNLYLDEFAFHKDSQAIWKAAYPCLRGRLRMIVSSTPQGKGNRFYQIATDTTGIWSIHRVDIVQAVEMGLPFDLDYERRALNDEDAWKQEYLLQWLDENSAWLSYDLISSCESDVSGAEKYQGGLCYVGNDIARRKHLWVAWVLEQVGDVLVTREVVELVNASFAEQDAELDRIEQTYRVARYALDQTGIGEKPLEDAKERYGEGRVEGVVFTNTNKQTLATIGKQGFEDRTLRIPVGNSKIRNDLHSLRKVTTAVGNIRFDVDASETDGHGDRAWALFLAQYAASTPTAPVEFETVRSPRTSNDLWAGDMGMGETRYSRLVL